ncbi:MAG: hypothetical protein H7836_16820 [Magnetococcus sp. YQC-3]
MSSTLTVDDVWKMFQETNRLFQESQERWEQRHQEMERVLQADRAETKSVFQETERQIQETAAQMRETDIKVKQVSALVGNLGGRWGEFVEGLIALACIAMFRERGIQVDEIFPRGKKVIDGKHMEIDLLVANAVAAVLIEVKSQLQVEDVRNHLTRLAEFKAFFPRYANCQVYGAVAGIVVESKADQFAMKQGLFVIEQSGESVRLANDREFKPKVW